MGFQQKLPGLMSLWMSLVGACQSCTKSLRKGSVNPPDAVQSLTGTKEVPDVGGNVSEWVEEHERAVVCVWHCEVVVVSRLITIDTVVIPTHNRA